MTVRKLRERPTVGMTATDLEYVRRVSYGPSVRLGLAMIPEVSILDRSWIVLVSIARIDTGSIQDRSLASKSLSTYKDTLSIDNQGFLVKHCINNAM